MTGETFLIASMINKIKGSHKKLSQDIIKCSLAKYDFIFPDFFTWWWEIYGTSSYNSPLSNRTNIWCIEISKLQHESF